MNTRTDAAVIGALGVVTLTYVGWELRKAFRIRHWRHTTGRIIDARVGATDRDVVARFAYTVHGREYVGERLALYRMQTRHSSRISARRRAESLPRGTEVPVWYDPANPADSVSIRAIPLGFWFTGFVGVLFLGGALVAVARGVVR